MSFENTLNIYLENNPELGVIPKRQIKQALSIFKSTEDRGMAMNALNENVRESIFGEAKAHGGPVKKKRGSYMGGGKVHRKEYAKGGGVRKAARYS